MRADVEAVPFTTKEDEVALPDTNRLVLEAVVAVIMVVEAYGNVEAMEEEVAVK
jgi:hypothetical protein